MKSRICVDLAGVEERAREGRPALDQQVLDLAASELVERGLEPRRGRPARSHDHLGPGALQRVALSGGRLGRADHDQRRLVDRADQRGVDGQPCVGVEDDPGWAVARRPSSRAVSSGSSASAVPMPTATASHSARQRWTSSRLSTLEIQRESPVGEATRPSSDIAAL